MENGAFISNADHNQPTEDGIGRRSSIDPLNSSIAHKSTIPESKQGITHDSISNCNHSTESTKESTIPEAVTVKNSLWQRGVSFLKRKSAKECDTTLAQSEAASTSTAAPQPDKNVVLVQLPYSGSSSTFQIDQNTTKNSEMDFQGSSTGLPMTCDCSDSPKMELSRIVSDSSLSSDGIMCRICHGVECENETTVPSNNPIEPAASPHCVISVVRKEHPDSVELTQNPKHEIALERRLPNGFIAPCLCSGSLKYVHQHCLQQWIKMSHSNYCELCHFSYIMKVSQKPFRKWEPMQMSKTDSRKLICSVLFHVIALGCVFWSLFVLIERTMEEVNRDEFRWPFWTKLVVVSAGFIGGFVFMYVQFRMYVSLCERWRHHNHIFLVQTVPPDELHRASMAAKAALSTSHNNPVVNADTEMAETPPHDAAVPSTSSSSSDTHQGAHGQVLNSNGESSSNANNSSNLASSVVSFIPSFLFHRPN